MYQELLSQESESNHFHDSLKDASALFNKSCLSAIHWWVLTEHAYHHTFNNHGSKLESDFLKFTNDYSVLMFVKSDVRLEVLNNLISAGFIKEIQSQNHNSNINSYLNLTETTYNRKKAEMLIRSTHLSMLTKFATLINPEEFTMLDRNAIASLATILHDYNFNFSKSQLKNDYAYFKEGFNQFRNVVGNYSYFDDIKKYYQYLSSNFPNHQISELAFQNRVLDKFLWHTYYDNKHNKNLLRVLSIH